MTAKKTSNREMFTKTRRAWKDGSKVEINFTSVNGKASNDYTVTLWLDGEHIDTCDCKGFLRYGHCCHVDHYRLVEGLCGDKARAMAALVSRINTKFGKVVIRVGVPDAQPAPAPVRLTEVLNGNRFSVPAPKEAPKPASVSSDWLLGRRSA
jgi:hypothetical protein